MYVFVCIFSVSSELSVYFVTCISSLFTHCVPLLSESVTAPTSLSSSLSFMTVLFQAGSVLCSALSTCSSGLGGQAWHPSFLLPLEEQNPTFSFVERITLPESGHDLLRANEINQEALEDNKRGRHRRRRVRKTGSNKAFTLSPEFLQKYISSTPNRLL